MDQKNDEKLSDDPFYKVACMVYWIVIISMAVAFFVLLSWMLKSEYQERWVLQQGRNYSFLARGDIWAGVV